MRMDTVSKRILEAEAHLPQLLLTVDELCREIGVHRATWQRWKKDRTKPRVTRWREVEPRLVRLIERAKARAA